MTQRIVVKALAAARGRAVLVPPQSFSLSSGEALLVTGPNGAGKSTFLRTLAGLLPPAGGRIAMQGFETAAGEAPRSLAEIAHYVGHRNAMKPGVTVRANLLFWQALLGQGEGLDAEAALGAMGLGGLSHLAFGYLSAGQQRRAALARLLAVHRPVWILDEPTAALDAAAQALFAGVLARHLAAGGILLAATHQPLGIEGARTLRLEQRAAAPLGEGIAESDLAAAEGWL